MHICRHYRLLIYDNREMGTAVFLFSKNENLHFQEGSGSPFEKVVMFMSFFFFIVAQNTRPLEFPDVTGKMFLLTLISKYDVI